jgi:1-acyl-sn-glycerol-3-phosphate acyltransferase
MSSPADSAERFLEALAKVPVRQGRLDSMLRWVFRAFSRIVGWHLDVNYAAGLPTGEDKVPGAGCVVVAAPHRAWVEPFLLFAAWPRDGARLVWLADGATVTGSWWRRRLLPRLGVIPIVGGVRGPRSYAEQAALALERGLALVVFPEVGPPSPDDEPRRISPGFAYIARQAGASVVPVVVGGTHHIVRGSTFSVDFLESIAAGPADRDAVSNAGRSEAHELARQYEAVVLGLLPSRNADVDALRPAEDRWSWLGRLFR